MVSFIVRMRFAPEDRENISDILRQLALASRQEPGCVSYVPHTVEDDPSVVVIYEQYRDRAASEFHRTTPHFKKFAVGGLVSAHARARGGESDGVVRLRMTAVFHGLQSTPRGIAFNPENCHSGVLNFD